MITAVELERRLSSHPLTPRDWLPMRSRALRLVRLFAARYGAGRSGVRLCFVPGRLEVLGKHTDYAGGHTLVCAIDRGFLMVAGASGGRTVRMSEDRTEFPALQFPLREDITPPVGSWGNYPLTVARRVAANFGASKGVDLVFSSDLPVGSGLSGSSALMMMTFVALEHANNLHASSLFRRNVRDGIDLATYLACCENGQTFRGLRGARGVGTFGGSEDHTAILLGRSGTLSLYEYAPTTFKAEVAWPASHELAVCFSGVRAEKTGAAQELYNRASRRARAAVAACNKAWRSRNATLREVIDHASARSPSDPMREVDAALRRASSKELDLPGRARQFYIEDRLVLPAAVRALAWEDIRRFGLLLDRSHDASRRLLKNIAPQVETLHRLARALGAAGSCGFGAGFGGSILAVVRADRSEHFLTEWHARYRRGCPEEARAAELFTAAPSDGIRVWDGKLSGRWVDSIFGAQM